jgi:hypothetical protein
MVFVSAHHVDRLAGRREGVSGSVIGPALPPLCFVAKSVGLMTFFAGIGASAWAAWS